jgi:hypothetical protein
LKRKPKQSEADKMQARQERDELAAAQAHGKRAEALLAEQRGESAPNPKPEPVPFVASPDATAPEVPEYLDDLYEGPTMAEFYENPTPLVVREQAMRLQEKLEWQYDDLKRQRDAGAVNFVGHKRIERKMDENEAEWARLQQIIWPSDPITGFSLLQQCRTYGCSNQLFKTEAFKLLDRCERCHAFAYGRDVLPQHPYDQKGTV